MVSLIRNRHCTRRPAIASTEVIRLIRDRNQSDMDVALSNYDLKRFKELVEHTRVDKRKTLIGLFADYRLKQDEKIKEKILNLVEYIIDISDNEELRIEDKNSLITIVSNYGLPIRFIYKLMDKEIDFNIDDLKVIHDELNTFDINNVNLLVKLHCYLNFKRWEQNETWEQYKETPKYYDSFEQLLELNNRIQEQINFHNQKLLFAKLEEKIQRAPNDSLLFQDNDLLDYIQWIEYGTYLTANKDDIPFLVHLSMTNQLDILNAIVCSAPKNFDLNISYTGIEKRATMEIKKKNKTLLMQLIESIDTANEKDKEKRYNIIKTLIQKTDLRLQMEDGNSALMFAIELKDKKYGTKIALDLLKKSPRIIKQSRPDKYTPFLLAAKNGNLEVAKKIEFLDMDSVYELPIDKNKNAFNLAAENGHYEFCKHYADYYSRILYSYDSNDNAIFYAIKGKNANVIRLCINPISIKLQKDGYSPFQRYLSNCKMTKKDIELLDALIGKKGFDPHIIDYLQDINGHIGIFEKLFSNLIETIDKDLDSAILIKKLNYLLNLGIDPTRFLTTEKVWRQQRKREREINPNKKPTMEELELYNKILVHHLYFSKFRNDTKQYINSQNAISALYDCRPIFSQFIIGL